MTKAVEPDFDNGTFPGVDNFDFPLLGVVLSLDLACSFFVDTDATGFEVSPQSFG